MDNTQGSGWNGELMDLQRETQALLASVRGTGNMGRTRRGDTGRRSTGGASDDGSGGADKKPKGGKTKRRKRGQQQQVKELARSSSMSQLMQQSSNHRQGGRETMEVLDTASNPSTARSHTNEYDYELGANDDGEEQRLGAGSGRSNSTDRHSQQSQSQLSRASAVAVDEAAARNLDFTAEQQRVADEMDTFVPRAGARLEELDAERIRLEGLQRRAVEAHFDRQELAAGIEFRQEFKEKDDAAVKVQALFRGGVGRRRVALHHERAALEARIREDWVEVRDEESGDVWYFNQSSGESQWDMPEALAALIPSSDRIKKLPALSTSQESDSGPEPNQILESTQDIQVQQQPESDSTVGSLPGLKNSSSRSNMGNSNNSVEEVKKGEGNQQQQQQQQQQQSSGRHVGGSGNMSLPSIDQRTGEVNPSGQGAKREVFRDGHADYEDEELEGYLDEGPEGGIMATGDKRRLFLADDSVNKGMLRDTVRSTLKQSRFDSVATLLMGPGAEAAESENARPKGAANSSSGGGVPSASGPDRKPVILAPTGPGVGGGGRGAAAHAPKGQMVAHLKISKSPKAKRPRPSVASSSVASVKSIQQLTLRDVEHPGFDLGNGDSFGAAAVEVAKDQGQSSGAAGQAGADVTKRVEEICFNCWSSGKGKFCALHKTEERMTGMRASESALMCKNWNLGVLQKRYRSEDIQEVFMKSAASLRYDRDRKRFVTVEEQKHPIYRGLSNLLSRYNFTARRKIHQAVWLRSMVESLRAGKLNIKEGGSHAAAMLKLRNTIFNSRWVRQYASSVAHLHPKGPITGTSLPERRGLVQYLVAEDGVTWSHIFAPPVPEPVALYLAREYTLPAARSIPMPRPSYKTAPVVASPNAFIAEDHPAAWLERFAARAGREAMQAAGVQVAALSPVPGVELLRRTKYAAPQTIKFAQFARKPTPGNLAVGGLAAELTVHELVQTLIPPQFGNYTVMHKTAVAPAVSEEITAVFDPQPADTVRQIFVFRVLQHPLNSRRPPTIGIPTAQSEAEKHFYGRNRPEQTGEDLSHGFRTSAYASGCDAILVRETNVQAFEPSSAVSTPNLPAANQTVTTHVDHTYPFCEPSNRNNTTLDFYHLLLFGTCAPNKEQVFTNFGSQECGDFMKETDQNRPMGHCISHVYRSWAFVQRQMIEEFLTDDGLPYWYDRRSGETFWERPLAPEEQLPVKDGGTVLSVEPSDAEARVEDTTKKYRQDDVRKVILKKHEGADDMLDRRKHAAQSAKWAREEGILPERPGTAQKAATPGGMGAAMNDGGSVSSGESGLGGLGGLGGMPPMGAGGRSGVLSGSATSEGSGSRPGSRASSPSRGGVSSPSRPATGGGMGMTMGGMTPLQGGGAGNNAMVQTLSTALTQVLPQLQAQGANPVDLLQLGMGLGMSLQQQGLLPNNNQGLQQGSMMDMTNGTGVLDESQTMQSSTTSVTGNGMPQMPQGLMGGQPIGVVDATASNRTAQLLDHQAEDAQKEAFAQIDPSLTTVEQYKGMTVVPTVTPDEEVEGHIMHVSRELEAQKQVPVYAYPPELLGKDYDTHPVAGVGESFLPEGQGTDQKFVDESKRTLRRAGDVLPEGFFNAIYATHIGKAEVDYLPTVPNLPQPRPVGRVKPRSAAEDWFAIGFDPWSAGKDPLSREFIPTLMTKEESLLEQQRKRADDAFIEVMDQEGMQKDTAEASAQAKLLGVFNELASHARHGKYREIEDTMNQPDYNLPIDFQDDGGNTLLQIAAQNGNKRIAKLCLRRGATINKQNLAGQTVLHYAYGYGFQELFEYFISKGADDSLKNSDGLTCYEGLDMKDVSAI